MAFNAPKYLKTIDGTPLGERMERFAGTFVETRNPLRAYRMAFVVDRGELPAETYRRAQELLGDVDVMQRIAELRDEATQKLIMGARDLMQDWHDIASADVNDIVSHERGACRCCYGIGHKYQWIDADEFADKCAEVQRKNDKIDKPAFHDPLPTCEGGFGYVPLRSPNYECPRCFGEGVGRVRIADTRTLQGAARKLLASVEEDRFGAIKVTLHDQQKARESLARCYALFKDSGQLPIVPPGTGTPKKDEGPPTLEKATRSYLSLVHGGKK